jgi:hypothetical protein
MKKNLLLIVFTSVFIVNCPEPPADPVAENAPLLLLAAAAQRPATTGSGQIRPSQCNTTGVASGCGGTGGNFSCSATSRCYRSYDLCAADTSCQTFSYSPSLFNLRVGDTINASVSSSLSGTNLVYSISSGTLPEGLTLNATTGLISGTTTTSRAQSTTVISVSNALGSATSSNTNRVYSAAEAAPVTCNTTGIAPGCTGGAPFSCTNSGSCFTTVSACRANVSCTF